MRSQAVILNDCNPTGPGSIKQLLNMVAVLRVPLRGDSGHV